LKGFVVGPKDALPALVAGALEHFRRVREVSEENRDR
jgi:hypothetical protein